MKKKLIGKFNSSRFVDLGDIYPIGFAYFKGEFGGFTVHLVNN